MDLIMARRYHRRCKWTTHMYVKVHTDIEWYESGI